MLDIAVQIVGALGAIVITGAVLIAVVAISSDFLKKNKEIGNFFSMILGFAAGVVGYIATGVYLELHYVPNNWLGAMGEGLLPFLAALGLFFLVKRVITGLVWLLTKL